MTENSVVSTGAGKYLELIRGIIDPDAHLTILENREARGKFREQLQAESVAATHPIGNDAFAARDAPEAKSWGEGTVVFPEDIGIDNRAARRSASGQIACIRVSFQPDRALAGEVRDAEITRTFSIACTRGNDIPGVAATAAVRNGQPGAETVCGANR